MRKTVFAGLIAAMTLMAASAAQAAPAAPLPVGVAADHGVVTQIQWRWHHSGHRGWGYRHWGWGYRHLGWGYRHWGWGYRHLGWGYRHWGWYGWHHRRWHCWWRYGHRVCGRGWW